MKSVVRPLLQILRTHHCSNNSHLTPLYYFLQKIWAVPHILIYLLLKSDVWLLTYDHFGKWSRRLSALRWLVPSLLCLYCSLFIWYSLLLMLPRGTRKIITSGVIAAASMNAWTRWVRRSPLNAEHDNLVLTSPCVASPPSAEMQYSFCCRHRGIC